MPETLELPVTAPIAGAELPIPTDAELSYRAGINRACERSYQTWAAEFDRRAKDLMRDGMGAEQAGRRVMEQLGEFRRELRAELADTLLLEEAELLQAAGELS